jgi:hypothetical protein
LVSSRRGGPPGNGGLRLGTARRTNAYGRPSRLAACRTTGSPGPPRTARTSNPVGL